MAPEDGFDNDTVNTRSPPSVTDTSSTETVGGSSSSTILPSPLSDVSPTAPITKVTPRVRVSRVGTVAVADGSPGANVIVMADPS